MKRIVLAVVAVIAAMSALGADVLDMMDSGTNKARFGLRLSWDLNSASTSLYKPATPIKNGSGLQAGAFYTVPVYKNLYVEPGLGFFYNTMLINYDIPANISLGYPFPPEGSLRNSGFRIPLNVGYRFDFTDDISMSVFTGPQMDVGVKLVEHDSSEGTSTNLYKRGWRRVDAQWLIGVRFHYADNWIAEITGGIGMTNMLGGNKYHGNHFRRNTFSIGVGYVF